MNFNLLDNDIHDDEFEEFSSSLLQKIQKLGYAALFSGILLLIFTVVFGIYTLQETDMGINNQTGFIIMLGIIMSTSFFCSVFIFILFRTCRLQVQDPKNLDLMKHISNLILCIWISVIIGVITFFGILIFLL